MQSLDKEKVRKVLMEEEHLPSFRVDLILKEFPPIDEALATAVKQWLEKRSFDDVQVDGLSISEVMRLRRCHFLIAVKDLARLQDPELPAESRRRLREILSKPVIIQ